MDKIGIDPERTLDDCHAAPRPVVAFASHQPDGEHIAPHQHPRCQLLHALSGVMTISSSEGSWIVPTGRAVWMPAHAEHAIRIAGDVAMRTVFVAPDASPDLATRCEVIEVSPLLRELIVAATRIDLAYATEGRDALVMDLILKEIAGAPRLSLHVPMPRDPRLAKLCAAMVADPAEPVTLNLLARQIHVSSRTLARMFHRELGMSFGEWLRRMRLLLAVPRLAAGASVLEVALEHGYDSPSAFAAMFRRTLGVAPTAYLTQGR